MASTAQNAVQSSDIERIAAAIAATPPDKQSILLAISEAVIIGAKIADQCAALVQQDAS